MNKDNNEKVYSLERSNLIKSEYHAADQFDKTLITLSTGSLYLSFYFVKDFESDNYCLLGIALSLFIISIIMVLLSFLLSERAFRKQLEILDKKYDLDDKNYSEENIYSNLIKYLQTTSFVSLIFGMIFLTFFYFSNL
jgi:hypothetical protein